MDEEVIDQLFLSCVSGTGQDNVEVQTVVEYLKILVKRDSKSKSNEPDLVELENILNSHSEDGLVDIRTFRKALKQWISQIRNRSESTSFLASVSEPDLLNMTNNTTDISVFIEVPASQGDSAFSNSNYRDDCELLNDLKFQNKRLLEENGKLQSQLECQEETLAVLTKQLENKAREEEQMKKKIESLQDQITLGEIVVEENEVLKSKLDNLQEVKRELDIKLTNLEQENAILDKQAWGFENKWQKSLHEMDSLKRELEELQFSFLEQKEQLSQTHHVKFALDQNESLHADDSPDQSAHCDKPESMSEINIHKRSAVLPAYMSAWEFSAGTTADFSVDQEKKLQEKIDGLVKENEKLKGEKEEAEVKLAETQTKLQRFGDQEPTCSTPLPLSIYMELKDRLNEDKHLPSPLCEKDKMSELLRKSIFPISARELDFWTEHSTSFDNSLEQLHISSPMKPAELEIEKKLESLKKLGESGLQDELIKLYRVNLDLAEKCHKAELRETELQEQMKKNSEVAEQEKQKCSQLEESLYNSVLTRNVDLKDLWRLVHSPEEEEDSVESDSSLSASTEILKQQIKQDIEALREKLRKRESVLQSMRKSVPRLPSKNKGRLPPSALVDALNIDHVNLPKFGSFESPSGLPLQTECKDCNKNQVENSHNIYHRNNNRSVPLLRKHALNIDHVNLPKIGSFECQSGLPLQTECKDCNKNQVENSHNIHLRNNNRSVPLLRKHIMESNSVYNNNVVAVKNRLNSSQYMWHNQDSSIFSQNGNHIIGDNEMVIGELNVEYEEKHSELGNDVKKLSEKTESIQGAFVRRNSYVNAIENEACSGVESQLPRLRSDSFQSAIEQGKTDANVSNQSVPLSSSVIDTTPENESSESVQWAKAPKYASTPLPVSSTPAVKSVNFCPKVFVKEESLDIPDEISDISNHVNSTSDVNSEQSGESDTSPGISNLCDGVNEQDHSHEKVLKRQNNHMNRTSYKELSMLVEEDLPCVCCDSDPELHEIQSTTSERNYSHLEDFSPEVWTLSRSSSGGLGQSVSVASCIGDGDHGINRSDNQLEREKELLVTSQKSDKSSFTNIPNEIQESHEDQDVNKVVSVLVECKAHSNSFSEMNELIEMTRNMTIDSSLGSISDIEHNQEDNANQTNDQEVVDTGKVNTVSDKKSSVPSVPIVCVDSIVCVDFNDIVPKDNSQHVVNGSKDNSNDSKDEVKEAVVENDKTPLDNSKAFTEVVAVKESINEKASTTKVESDKTSPGRCKAFTEEDIGVIEPTTESEKDTDNMSSDKASTAKSNGLTFKIPLIKEPTIQPVIKYNLKSPPKRMTVRSDSDEMTSRSRFLVPPDHRNTLVPLVAISPLPSPPQSPCINFFQSRDKMKGPKAGQMTEESEIMEQNNNKTENPTVGREEEDDMMPEDDVPKTASYLARIRETHLAKRRDQLRQSKMPELSELSEKDGPDDVNKQSTNNNESDVIQPPEPNGDILPSIPTEFLEKLGLSSDDINSDELSDQEIESKFASLSLAFKTDAQTLEKRLEIQERSRDIAEQNVDKELQGLRTALSKLNQICTDPQVRELLSKIQNHVEILEKASARVSSRAEVFGAIQQEKRLSKAVDIMVHHVENIHRVHEKEHAELEEARKLLQDSRSLGPSALDITGVDALSRRSASVCPNNIGIGGKSFGLGTPLSGGLTPATVKAIKLMKPRRRVSEIALPKVLGGSGAPNLHPSPSMDHAFETPRPSRGFYPIQSEPSIDLDEGIISQTVPNETSESIGRTFDKDPRSRFQAVVASTTVKSAITNNLRKVSYEKQNNVSTPPPSNNESPQVSRTNSADSSKDAQDKEKQKNLEEEAFKKGYEQGMRASLGQDLSSLREQQNRINESLGDIMDNIDNSMEEPKGLREILQERFQGNFPKIQISSWRIRLTMSCFFVIMAILSILMSLFPVNSAEPYSYRHLGYPPL